MRRDRGKITRATSGHGLSRLTLVVLLRRAQIPIASLLRRRRKGLSPSHRDLLCRLKAKVRESMTP